MQPHIVCFRKFLNNFLKRVSAKCFSFLQGMAGSMGFQTLSCGCMSYHNASMLCFSNRVACIVVRSSFLRAGGTFSPLFARHNRVHVHFQLSPCMLNGFFVFFIFRVNKVDASQSSSIFEFWRLLCQRLFQFWSILEFIPWEVPLSIT